MLKKNLELAKQWKSLAKVKSKRKYKRVKRYDLAQARAKVVEWTANTNKMATDFAQFKLTGILSDWRNKKVVNRIGLTQSPKMASIKLAQIFNQRFQLTNPNSIKAATIINYIGAMRYRLKKPNWQFPQYRVPVVLQHPQQLQVLRNQALHGFVKSQFMLGLMYQLGVGVEKDYAQALTWYTKAAAQKNAKAYYAIGLLYLNGEGVARNYKTAQLWLEKAAFRGNAYAQYVLALLHEFGYGDASLGQSIAVDLDYAHGMYNLAVSNGLALAQLNLADLYLSGLLNKVHSVHLSRKLHKQILKLYQQAAKQGLPQAKLALAYYYVGAKHSAKRRQWAFEVANQLANKGDAMAVFLLALMYDRGIGVSKKRAKAIKLYALASQHNNPLADFILGSYYYLGAGVSKDAVKAVALLTQAADKKLAFAEYNLAIIRHQQQPAGNFERLLHQAAAKNYLPAKLLLADYNVLHHSDDQKLKVAADSYAQLASRGYAQAQLRLAYLYEHGIYFRRSYSEAVYWYQQAAKQDNQLAQYLVANMYQLGKLGQPNLTAAKRWYRRAAKQGLVVAQLALGYLEDSQLHQYKAAVDWYQQAAKQGNVMAQYNLALIYAYGKGVKVDYQQAYDWFLQAANAGYAPAQVGLANLYLHALGVKYNARKAYKWYQKAVLQGDVVALYQLGLLHESGVGTSLNLQQALPYYQVAATKGLVKAQLALARIYDSGEGGVAVNHAKALTLYRQAAARGNAFAQYQLARKYQLGVTVAKNMGKSLQYYQRAMLNGNELAKQQWQVLSNDHGIAEVSSDNQVNGISYIDADKFHQAIVSLVHPQANQPTDINMKWKAQRIYMLALNRLNQGELQQSLKILKQLSKIDRRFQPAQELIKHYTQTSSRNLVPRPRRHPGI